MAPRGGADKHGKIEAVTFAQKFLSQVYAVLQPEWGAVHTFSLDGEFEIEFADGSAVWGTDGKSRWSESMFYREGHHPRSSSIRYLQEVTQMPGDRLSQRLKDKVICAW